MRIHISLLKYLKNRYGFPDPKGELLSSISSLAIALASHKVQAELTSAKTENGGENVEVW